MASRVGDAVKLASIGDNVEGVKLAVMVGISTFPAVVVHPSSTLEAGRTLIQTHQPS